jgi:hypothetical protein
MLARLAYLEAASVPAFERLARELEAHGAPLHLRQAALRAARDEVRHARVMAGFARRAGAAVRRPRVARGGVRSLVAIALENVVEGCVNETFGAAVAVAQSMTASDARLRRAMERIAGDELRHAELAWRVARWIDGRLEPRERARVARAQRKAVKALARQTAQELPREVRVELGLLDAPLARGVVAGLSRELWAA